MNDFHNIKFIKTSNKNLLQGHTHNNASVKPKKNSFVFLNVQSKQADKQFSMNTSAKRTAS